MGQAVEFCRCGRPAASSNVPAFLREAGIRFERKCEECRAAMPDPLTNHASSSKARLGKGCWVETISPAA